MAHTKTSPIRSFRDLVAWQRAMDLVASVYALTRGLPDEERFGLTSQMRRAAVSVPSNIAEGYGRGHTADYLRFLRQARGSLYELQTQIELLPRLSLIAQEAHQAVLEDSENLERILAALIRSLSNTTNES